ncbi:MAG: HAD family hydrolase [Candidatus Omnitrophota bacterium]
MRFKAVIFDLDGTLLDSLPDIAETMNAVLEKLSFPPLPTTLYKQYVGEGLRELVKKALPPEVLPADPTKRDESLDRFVTLYREIYDRQWQVHTRPYDGISEMLDALAAREVKLGILSNKLDAFTRRMVETLLPDWRFDVVFGSRSGVPLKPDPFAPLEMAGMMSTRPEEIVFMGDSGIDMQTGVNAGMFPVGVLWGLREIDELRACGARQLIAHPADLLPIVGSSIG